MKKFLSILMCMVLSLSCIVFAAGSPSSVQLSGAEGAKVDGKSVATYSVTSEGVVKVEADGTVTKVEEIPSIDTLENTILISSASTDSSKNGLSEEANKKLEYVAENVTNTTEIAKKFDDVASEAIDDKKINATAQALEANIKILEDNVAFYESKKDTVKAEEARKALAAEKEKLAKVNDPTYNSLAGYSVVSVGDVSVSPDLADKKLTVTFKVPGVDETSDVVVLNFHSDKSDVSSFDDFNETYVPKTTVTKDTVTVELTKLSPIAILVRTDVVVPGNYSAAAPTGSNGFAWVWAALAAMAALVAFVAVARKKNN